MKDVLLLLLFFSSRLPAQPVNDSVFSNQRLGSFALTEAGTNKPVHVASVSNTSSKAILFIFLSPDCPICRGYSPEINRLVAMYGNSTDVYGIIPGKTYSNGAIDSFARQFHISYRLLTDKTLGLSRYLQASVTPEVILINNHNELIYKGAIDDGVAALGRSGARVRRHYLADALSAAQHSESVAEKRTRAVGCILNDY